MIKLYNSGAFLINGTQLVPDDNQAAARLSQIIGRVPVKEDAVKSTITFSVLQSHNVSGNTNSLQIKFDTIASHDLTYVGVIQTAKASGLDEFSIPYILTNCHNSLCAVGGTLNEDDHQFGLSAAQKYGGIYVPPHLAVIHQYMREIYAACGGMILGSDSHTRYGALGTLGIGEGGGELVKQLLGKTYDISYPKVIGIYLTGKPHPGVGPQDIALAIIGAVFKNGYVKNKVMEFIGDGINNLSIDYRNGIDVMTTETACLTSIWKTDTQVQDYFTIHHRPEAYRELEPGTIAYYDGLIYIDLSTIKPMIALPFHPCNVYEIDYLNQNLEDILHLTEQEAVKLIENPKVHYHLTNKIDNGKLKVDQGVIAGCAGGTYENIMEVSSILKGKNLGNDQFALSIYPASQPMVLELMRQRIIPQLLTTGAIIRTAFCGPCFGAGDVPANNWLSIRHTTRNFPNREGSKPNEGQMAGVALMDARSIAATAINGGFLTPATDLDISCNCPKYFFDRTVYTNRVYDGYHHPQKRLPLKYGPNIVDWPEMGSMEENMLIRLTSLITDPVTTTDELIPSGDTSTFRSNPLAMADFTLYRKDPSYVENAKRIQHFEKQRLQGIDPVQSDVLLQQVFAQIQKAFSANGTIDPLKTQLGSAIYAIKPGDGSAREQAASCQKVLGGCVNIAREYATKRYRSNLINWGIIPFILKDTPMFHVGDHLYLPGVRSAIIQGKTRFKAYLFGKANVEFELFLDELTQMEREILLAGCLINYYRLNK